MFYYPVLTTKKLPVIFYYSSKIALSIGQIVIVPLQSQLIEGIIFQNPKTENEIIEMSIELGKIKEIHQIKPFILHINQTQFIKFLINNTFGNPGVILTTFLQSFKLLSANSWKILQTNYQKNNFDQKSSENNLVSNLENFKNPSDSNFTNSQNTNENEKINSKNILLPNIQKSPKTEKLVNYLEIEQKQNLQQLKPEFNFWLEQNYTQRIIYIIRNWKQKMQKNLEKNNQILNQKLAQNVQNKQFTNLVKTKVENNLENLDNNYKKIEKNNLQKISQNDKKNIFDIVIIFPEKKLVDKVYKNLKDLPLWKNFLYKLENENWVLENYFFSSQVNKESRQTVLALLGIETDKKNTKSIKSKIKQKNAKIKEIKEIEEIEENVKKFENSLKIKMEINYKEDIEQNIELNSNYKIRLIWGTRSSLFLPFTDLTNIILIDEANSFHIQEQNGLYFDTREAVFLLHRACGINLDFVSILPSVRFQNFYKSIDLTKNNSKNNPNFETDYQKNSQIKITKFNKKYDNYQLFSHQIEQLLQTDQDFEYFGED